jgi:hypothetical protein
VTLSEWKSESAIFSRDYAGGLSKHLSFTSCSPLKLTRPVRDTREVLHGLVDFGKDYGACSRAAHAQYISSCVSMLYINISRR